MSDLATNAGGPPPQQYPSSHSRTYNVYLSYHPSERSRVTEISDRLQKLKRALFDENELIAGESQLTAREDAMAGSGCIALLVGADGLNREMVEESRQALRRSIDSGIRAFYVYLPGYDPSSVETPDWLKDPKPLDLRDRFDEGTLTFEGLVDVLAAVDGVTLDDARTWLVQQIGPPARAAVITVRHYQQYDELSAADADRAAVGAMLEASGTDWEITSCRPQNRADLFDACTALFDDAAEDETVLLYFSGHGDRSPDGEEVFLCAPETNGGDFDGTAVRIQTLATRVKKSPSRHKIVVLDCCFSGEASDAKVDWGNHAAVFTTSRQWVLASGGTSELTEAITRSWRAPASTTGDLAEALAGVDFRRNAGFDGTISLRLNAAVDGPRSSPPHAARLHFDANGGLSVRTSRDARESPVDASWMKDREELVTNLIELVDTVVSLVPPDRLPMSSVKQALSTLGNDLLRSTLTPTVRGALADLDQWSTLHLELAFEQSGPHGSVWERVPWECLTLCTDEGRPVSLERVVPARTTKSSIDRQAPRRVIVWNAFLDPSSYDDGSQHLFTHLLRAQLAGAEPSLVVKEPAVWKELFDASWPSVATKERVVTDEHGAKHPIRDFDTLVLFAPVRSGDAEPEISLFTDKNVLTSITSSTLLTALKNWTCNYVILETVAGPPQRRADAASAQARSLLATIELATRLARELNASVVATCHSAHLLELARPSDESSGADRTFAGALLAELADTSKTLYEAAAEARSAINARMNLGDSLDVGLPIVCRPEATRVSRADLASPVGSTRVKESASSSSG